MKKRLFITMKERNSEKVTNSWIYYVIALFFVVTLAYILIKQDNIYIQIHDLLDSNIAWIKMLKDNNTFGKRNVTVPFLGGIDRNYLYSELKAYMWLYMLFPTFQAIIIGWYVKIVMAMGGFIFLIKSIDYKIYYKNKALLVWCGFLYGLAPTYPPTSFAFASLPILLGVILRCYKKFSWKYLILLLLYPVLSDFTLFGIFICGYLVVFFFIDWMVKKKACLRLLGCISVLVIGYIIVEWRLFDVMVFSNQESLRSAMNVKYIDLLMAIKKSTIVFIKGYYHCGSLHTYVILPVCIIYVLYTDMLYLRNRDWRLLSRDPINWILFWIIFNCMVYGLESVKIFRELVERFIPILRSYSFARTIWFNPFLWYTLFFLVLVRINKQKIVYTVAILAGLVVCIGPETYNHIFFNCLDITCDIIGEKKVEQIIGRNLELLSYREFYSEELFTNIKEDIAYEGEWAIAFGMHPSILEYNGISTLDGYLSYYPQNYKEKFRKLIEPQLKLDEVNREYFDSWGGRAYIYSDEISYNPSKIMSKEEANMNIDPDIFREMGGKYVFSRVRISNAKALSLDIVGIYTDEFSPYTIHVYRLEEINN